MHTSWCQPKSGEKLIFCFEAKYCKLDVAGIRILYIEALSFLYLVEFRRRYDTLQFIFPIQMFLVRLCCCVVDKTVEAFCDEALNTRGCMGMIVAGEWGGLY